MKETLTNLSLKVNKRPYAASLPTLPTLRSGIKLRLTASLSHSDYLHTSLGLNGPSAFFTDNIAHPPLWQPDSALPRALRETSVAATMR